MSTVCEIVSFVQNKTYYGVVGSKYIYFEPTIMISKNFLCSMFKVTLHGQIPKLSVSYRVFCNFLWAFYLCYQTLIVSILNFSLRDYFTWGYLQFSWLFQKTCCTISEFLYERLAATYRTCKLIYIVSLISVKTTANIQVFYSPFCSLFSCVLFLENSDHTTN